MDAVARRSSSRVHTILTLTVLVCISFIVVFSRDSDNHLPVRHERRRVNLAIRQDSISSTTTTASATSSFSFFNRPGPSGSSSDAPSFPPSQSPAGSSVTSSTIRSSSSPPATSVSQTSNGVSSSSSRSSQSAQTSLPPATSETRSSSTRTGASTQPTLPVPATTLALTDYLAPTSVQTSSIETSSAITDPTPISAAVNSSSFWQKKGAVAATFVIVALVIVGISAVLIVTYLKKRSKLRQEQLHDEIFEKYSEPDHRSNSPGLSINNAPMDAFARRDVRHDSGAPFQSYAPTRVLHSSSPVQHPDYYNQPPSRYLAPSQAQAVSRKAVPPSSFHNPDARDSYQHSIDSFYGAAGQPSGYSS